MKIITLKFFCIVFGVLGSCCFTFSLNPGTVDPNDEFEVFSSREVTSINLPEEAFHPKVESIFIKTKIRFRYAKTRITSAIINPGRKKSQNVSYTLRIPHEAFITRFEMRINNEPEIYRARVVKAEEAKNMYEFAVGEGRSVTLGLLEQSELDFNVVVLKFVIGANTKVLFSLIYEERLPRIDDKYESILHLVPDYMSNKTNFRVEVVIEENLKITDVTVPLDREFGQNATITRKSSKKANIVWSNFNQGEIKWKYPGTEFIVSYSLENEISTGHVLLRNGYFVHFFTPTDIPPLRKHVIFILDISDSMTGLKMSQTISAMTEILDELKTEDFFNIITFSSEVEMWPCFISKKDRERILPFPASLCKEKASFDMHSRKPHGSTNMYDALVKGLELARNVSPIHSPPKPQKLEKYIARVHSSYKPTLNDTLPQGVQSIIIFFTDGEPTSGIIDKRAILSKVKILNADLALPIFSLAFGNSADFAFLSKLSSRNGAFARKIYEDADPAFQLADFYREISSPVLANLSFKYESPTGSFSSADGSVTSSGYSMAFKGQDILTLGRINWSGKNESKLSSASISGVGRSGQILNSRIPIKDCSKPGLCPDETEFDDNSVQKLFVYLTMKRLLDEVFIRESERNFDEESINDVEQLKEEIVQLALKNGLITPFTSMVMKTKSTREQEMGDSETSVKPQVEIFLGSKSFSSNNSTKEREFNLDTFKYGILTSATHLNKALDIPIKFREENYNIFDISNSSILNNIYSIVRNNSLLESQNKSKIINSIFGSSQ